MRLPRTVSFNLYCLYKKHASGFNAIENLYNSALPAGYYLLEAIALFELAKKAKHPIVELGSYAGNGAVVLAEGSARGNKQLVYSIDPHTALKVDNHLYPDTKQLFQLNILKTRYAYLIKPIYLFSFEAIEAFKEKIGLLSIDTSIDSVSRDFIQWAPLVVKGGVITMRDYRIKKIADFIKEKILTDPDYADGGLVQNMQIILKNR